MLLFLPYFFTLNNAVAIKCRGEPGNEPLSNRLGKLIATLDPIITTIIFFFHPQAVRWHSLAAASADKGGNYKAVAISHTHITNWCSQTTVDDCEPGFLGSALF